MWTPPFLVLPLIAYNLVAFDAVGEPELSWASPIVEIALPSRTAWTLTVTDAVVLGALALLLVGLVRTNRAGRVAIRDLVISAAVLVVYVIEFLAVPVAATSLFVVCLAMSGIETINGFAVSLRHVDGGGGA